MIKNVVTIEAGQNVLKAAELMGEKRVSSLPVVSKGKLIEIDVDAFQIVDGRLLLQYSKGVRDDFNKDTKGNLAKAEANWPGLVEKKGK